jgi:hypothetical protein
MNMRHDFLFLFLSLLPLASAACSSSESDCDFARELQPGSVSGQIDGRAWKVEGATASMTGESWRVTAPRSDDWTLSVVAQTTPTGATLADVLEQGVFPIEVPLAGAAAGGWALMYHATDGTFSSQDAETGTLSLEGDDGEALWGCLSFTATNGERTIEFADGGFRITTAE